MAERAPERSRARERERLLERWVEVVLATYPEGARPLLARRDDPFGNPVGETVRASLAEALDALLGDAPPRAVAAALAPLVRVRAVQEFPPSRALAFVLRLRGLVREELGDAGAELVPRIEATLLGAFDLYVEARERLAEARVRAERRRTASLLRLVEKRGVPVPEGGSGA